MIKKISETRVLFVGDLNEGTRSFSRYLTLKKLGCKTEGVSIIPVPFIGGVDKPSLVSRVFHRIGLPLDLSCANQKLMSRTPESNEFDVCWVECAALLKPKVLRHLRYLAPDAVFITVSEDDMFAKHNRSLYFDSGLPLYDAVFTTKPYNINELQSLGARHVELFQNSYDEGFHRPFPEFESPSAKDILVGFIGTFEKERASSLLYLAQKGVEVEVFGSGWSKMIGAHPLLKVHGKPMVGEDYIQIINRTLINLCFLRKINRDKITSRSIEIPSCGGFMLAERTAEHKSMFVEGMEDEFFSGNEELLQKVQKYQREKDLAALIAKSGRVRCENGCYDMLSQTRFILSKSLSSC